MNEVKNMTKEELIDVLEEKGICVVLDNNLDDYIDYLNNIYEAFNEIVEQLQEAWLDRVRAGLDEEDFEEDLAKKLAKEFYYEDCILNEISIGNTRKFFRWLDDKSRFFTYVGLKSDEKSVDLVEYHPLTNLESYLLEDKQALETVFFGK